MSVFVDSSAWYAAADRSDRMHDRARQALSVDEPLVTSDHVLAESWLLIHHRLGQGAAERFWSGLRQGVAEIDCVGPADLEAAWRIGADFPGQDFSIVDRTSFAVMLRLGLRRVVSFDDDFAVFRFGRSRREAFAVLR